jgi:hypothetical protein
MLAASHVYSLHQLNLLGFYVCNSSTQRILVISVAGFTGFLVLPLVGLVGTQCLNMARNITTNEVVNVDRYV